MSPIELPELPERSGLGGRLVHRTVIISIVGVATLAAITLLVLMLFRIEITVEAGGFLEPLEVWRVHSMVEGIVEEVPVVSGTRIEQGEVLARLDAFALETQLADLRLEAKHQRHRPQDRAELERLDQAISTVEEQLRRLTLVAPESGVVLSEDLDKLIGQHVGRGQLLFEIGSADRWKAVLEVPEREIDPIRLGDPVRLIVPAIAEPGSWIPESVPATVVFIGSEPTEASTPNRSLYRLYAELDTPELDAADFDAERWNRLRRGMTVEARVITRSARAIDLLVHHFKRQMGIDG